MVAGTPTGQNMPLKPFPLDAGAANMLGRAQFQGLIWFCARLICIALLPHRQSNHGIAPPYHLSHPPTRRPPFAVAKA